MTANERRMQILNVILAKRSVTMLELQNEFHISRSTARRDIEELSLSHPIITAKGGGGGVSVMEGYKLGMKYFTNEELEIMNSILKTFKRPVSVK